VFSLIGVYLPLALPVAILALRLEKLSEPYTEEGCSSRDDGGLRAFLRWVRLAPGKSGAAVAKLALRGRVDG
jgi:hypothetical protein